MITTSHPGEWDALGVAQAVEPVAQTGIAPCVDCGVMRHVSRWPHAPRWLAGRLVDCMGREVG